MRQPKQHTRTKDVGSQAIGQALESYVQHGNYRGAADMLAKGARPTHTMLQIALVTEQWKLLLLLAKCKAPYTQEFIAQVEQKLDGKRNSLLQKLQDELTRRGA